MDMRAAISCVSEDGGVEFSLVEVFNERVEAAGDRTWVGTGEEAFGGGAGGPRVLPLPNTLPPPMVRRDIAL
jgi:hypothetical protein